MLTHVFDCFVQLIEDHQIFHNNSNVLQNPISIQLAIFLIRVRHYGNASGPEYSGLENHYFATVFEHVVDVTLQGVGMALSACREKWSTPSWLPDSLLIMWFDPIFKKICPFWIRIAIVFELLKKKTRTQWNQKKVGFVWPYKQQYTFKHHV